jgi:hypothetical protein
LGAILGDWVINKIVLAGKHKIGPGLPLPPPSAFWGRPITITEQRWTEVRFVENGQPVLPFLERAVRGVQGIAAKLKTCL